jgi:thioredoxin reductase (NADPH)
VSEAHKIVIIGGGPAGYTAAIYAARADLNPVEVEGYGAGGQLMITTDVENFPGFPDGVQGPELMTAFRAQAERFGTEILTEDVTRVDFSSRPFGVWVGDRELRAETVVVATGASARWLGIDSETKLRGHGVSSCATCDGFFFKDKTMVVVGGGDTAMEEALYLARIASHVTVVHRRDSFRASKIMADRVLAHPKITVMWNQGVQEILGDGSVTGIRLSNTQTGEVTEVATDAVFVAIGHTPNSELFVGQLVLDDDGYILAEGTVTSVDGVFAAGDIQDRTYRQAITAAASGCMAAIDAERWLEHNAHQPATLTN